MFDSWRRPSTDLPGVRDGWVISVAFDPLPQILSTEGMASLDAVLNADPRIRQFLEGLELARSLLLARGGLTYTDRHQIVSTVLFIKTLNDLLAASLLMRCGYALQAYPCMRSALESAEVIEYLSLRPDRANDYVRGLSPFDRDLTWIRAELPATAARRKAYGYFNYYTHANFKGLNIYTTYDASPGVVAAEVGPILLPVREIVPFIFASTLLAYTTRVLWQLDASAVGGEWISAFSKFDESTQEEFAAVPESDDKS